MTKIELTPAGRLPVRRCPACGQYRKGIGWTEGMVIDRRPDHPDRRRIATWLMTGLCRGCLRRCYRMDVGVLSAMPEDDLPFQFLPDNRSWFAEKQTAYRCIAGDDEWLMRHYSGVWMPALFSDDRKVALDVHRFHLPVTDKVRVASTMAEDILDRLEPSLAFIRIQESSLIE